MMYVELAICDVLLQDVATEAERALILGGNIARLFGIKI